MRTSRRSSAAAEDPTANWIGIDDLIRAKARIDDPRHQEDVRVLRRVKKLRQGRS